MNSLYLSESWPEPKAFEPTGIRFYDKASDRYMLLNQEPGSEWNGWLFYRHPDGMWVSLRKATSNDLIALNLEESNHEY